MAAHVGPFWTVAGVAVFHESALERNPGGCIGQSNDNDNDDSKSKDAQWRRAHPREVNWQPGGACPMLLAGTDEPSHALRVKIATPAARAVSRRAPYA